MRDLLNRLSGRQSKSQNNLSLNSFFDDHYYPHISYTKKTHAHDRYTYGKHFRKQLGKLPINRIDNKVADDWVRQQIAAGYKNSTINKHINMLVRMINVAQQWRMIDEKVFYSSMLRHLPMGNFRQRFLSEAEIFDLLRECKNSPHPFLYYFVQLLLLTGARSGEAQGAHWQDFDFNKNIWTVPVSKNGRSRLIILNSSVVSLLAELKLATKRLRLQVNSSSYIFINPKTKDRYYSFGAAFSKARYFANLDDVRIHDLRHTYASVLINSDVSLYEVQTLLGHSSSNMTQRYAHLMPNKLHERTEIVADVVRRFSDASSAS